MTFTSDDHNRQWFDNNINLNNVMGNIGRDFLLANSLFNFIVLIIRVLMDNMVLNVHKASH